MDCEKFSAFKNGSPAPISSLEVWGWALPEGFLLLSQTIRLRGADEEDGKKQTETRREGGRERRNTGGKSMLLRAPHEPWDT